MRNSGGKTCCRRFSTMSDKNFDHIDLDMLLEYLESGAMGNAPEGMVEYMQMLEMIWAMYNRHLDFPSNESIINHLVLSRNFTRPKAKKMVMEALTYFNDDKRQSKQMWNDRIADLGLKAFTFALQMAKSSRDIKDSIGILFKLGEYMGWDMPDVDKPDEEWIRQLQIVTPDIEMFGLEKIDKSKLKELVDNLPISDRMKETAMAEVDGIPFKLMMGQNPRNEQ